MSIDQPPGYTIHHPPTFYTLVTRDLKYCCLHFFFTYHKRTSLIAARLGLAPRTVREWKARWKAGEFPCTSCEGCARERLNGRLPRKV